MNEFGRPFTLMGCKTSVKSSKWHLIWALLLLKGLPVICDFFTQETHCCLLIVVIDVLISEPFCKAPVCLKDWFLMNRIHFGEFHLSQEERDVFNPFPSIGR